MMNTSAGRLALTCRAVTLSLVGASALLAAGCAYFAAAPQAPPPAQLVTEPGGAVIVDGQKTTTTEEFRVLLVERISALQALRRWAETNPGRLRGTLSPFDAVITVAEPDRTTYDEFCRVLLVCGSLGIESYEIAGVPVRFPGTSGPTTADAAAEPAPVRFLPMGIRKPADLDALAQHAAALNGLNVELWPDPYTPMSVVIAAMAALNAHGALPCLCVRPSPGDLRTRLLLEQAAPGGVYRKMAARGKGFFGIATKDEAKKIVYVIDRSGSMTDSIDYLKFELKRSIGDLAEDQEFHVIFYSSGPDVEMPARRLVLATDENMQAALHFIDGITAHGQTDPSEALKRAFAVGPDVIYLLTDGEFAPAVADLVRRMSPDRKVQVNTIAFLYDFGRGVLIKIARENGGTYTFVSEKDLARLVR